MKESEISFEDRVDILKKVQVFAELETSALYLLAGMLTERRTRSQEPVFKKGDEGLEMFILVDGEVRVHDGNHVITRLKSGDVFGEYSLIDKERRSASVTTERPCSLLLLNREDFSPFMHKNPELLFGMLQTQVKRMRDMNELEDKLSKSYLKISRQKEEIEIQNAAIREQKQLLESQNTQLKELNDYKKQLMSVLIHGMKNPLTSAMMMTDMLRQQSDLSKDSLQYIDILKQSMLRIDEVFNQIIRSNQKEELM
jgi:CRP/FNR family transcriptional regulator, cyclic AMP receptor protein